MTTDSTEDSGGTAIIVMAPVADLDKIEDMEQRFQDFLASGIAQFLIDFSECDYVNSSVLAMLVRMKKRVVDIPGSLSLVNVPDGILSILRTTNLDGFLLGNSDE